MPVKVEPIVFTVEEAARLAHCDVYGLLSLAVERGVKIFTYLPENCMAVSVDRRYVQGELILGPVSESILRWTMPTSVPCMSGFLLDAADCREIIRQKKFSRTFFDWGVVITGKESPLEVHGSDHSSLWSACLPPPNGDPATAMDLDVEIVEALETPSWMIGPPQSWFITQYCFGAYPAGLEVRPDYALLRFPRPREVVLHPDNLFLLKEGVDQLGLLESQDGRLAPKDASRAAQDSNEYPAPPVSAPSVEEPQDMGVGRVGDAAENGPTGTSTEVVATAQFADFQVQDHWPFWLKEFFKIASQEWVNWRKDQGALCTDEDRDRIGGALLSHNRNHKGRKITSEELKECVTLITPFWARHWERKELRDMSPPNPVAAELQEMIAVAERIHAFAAERTGRLTKTQVMKWLQTGKFHQFSKTKSGLVASLLIDSPKGGAKR